MLRTTQTPVSIVPEETSRESVGCSLNRRVVDIIQLPGEKTEFTQKFFVL